MATKSNRKKQSLLFFLSLSQKTSLLKMLLCYNTLQAYLQHMIFQTDVDGCCKYMHLSNPIYYSYMQSIPFSLHKFWNSVLPERHCYPD